jgi:hypothetical protein
MLQFSQIEWLFTLTPFDVLHEHFGNIGALDLRFYYIGLKFGTQAIKRAPSSYNLQNCKKTIFRLKKNKKSYKEPNLDI